MFLIGAGLIALVAVMVAMSAASKADQLAQRVSELERRLGVDAMDEEPASPEAGS